MSATWRGTTAAGLLLIVAAAGVSAQTRVVLGVGGGAIIPSKSSFEPPEVKSMGYHMQFMVGISPGGGKLSFRFDGQYASLNYEEQTSGARPKDKIFAVNADLVFHPSSGGSVRPYLLAGPTYGSFKFRSGLTSDPDESTSNVGFNAGAGINLGGSSKLWFFAESRYIYTKDHKYIPVSIGVRINTGQPFVAR
jgi:opacity protein-like surface antigen